MRKPDASLNSTPHRAGRPTRDLEGTGGGASRQGRNKRSMSLQPLRAVPDPIGATPPSAATLTHLQRLEAESIHIMREVVAECERPVMLYSIGKDSSVMLHLAAKAFYPSKPPFPLLHVDTTWKFRAMYEMRERMPRELGFELLVHQNPEAKALGINPFDHGPLHTDMWKTQGLKQALDKYGFDAAFGGGAPRRGEEPRQGAHSLHPQRPARLGSEEPAPRTLEAVQHQEAPGRRDPRLPDLQLDRARHLAIHPPGGHPDRAALLRRRAAGGRARRPADHGRRRALAASCPARRRRCARSASAPRAATR